MILEHDGPGAMVRFWTPLWNQRTQTVIRFYLDGSDQPAIEANYFDLLRGDLFIKKPFAFAATDEANTKAGVAGDLYLPISFATRCKITLDDVPFYYVINYRAYAAGTAVKSFSMDEYEAARAALEKTAQALNDYGNVTPGSRELAGDGEQALELPAGPGAVRTVQVTVPPDLPAQALRSLVVTMTFDGEETVWCPLGEFFGSGIRLNPVQDWYRTVAADGTLTCRWVMPYEKSGTIALKNLGKDPVKARLRATAGPWAWDERSLHFHANWRYQHPLATQPRSDWNYIEIQGAGVYAGDTLTVLSPSPAWYGEGDERIYVDGEAFPSHQGTGTEDYYGYAWGMAASSARRSWPCRAGCPAPPGLDGLHDDVAGPAAGWRAVHQVPEDGHGSVALGRLPGGLRRRDDVVCPAGRRRATGVRRPRTRRGPSPRMNRPSPSRVCRGRSKVNRYSRWPSRPG